MAETTDLFDLPAVSDKPRRPPVTYKQGALRGLVSAEHLRGAILFDRATVVMYGKPLKVPRGECFFSDVPLTYRYGGQARLPRPWPETVLRVRGAVEQAEGVAFQACFANLYESGDDCIAWHADDEAWIGPVIASASFGAPRRFRMRLKTDHTVTHEWTLGDGDVLVMGPGCQAAWEHCVPRIGASSAQQAGPRINLTFRQVVGA